MLNQVVLVGRLTKDPELKSLETGKRVTNIFLAIPRSFKNINGEYETDFVDCTLWDGVAESTVTYCKKGDLIGVRGRIQSKKVMLNEHSMNLIEIIAEKITFLANKKTDEVSETNAE